MKPLHIIFKPSVLLFTLILVVGVAAGAILILLTLPWLIKYSLLLILLASTAYVIAGRVLLLFPWSIVALNITAKNELLLMRRDGVKLSGLQVLKESVVHPYLTVLHYTDIDAAWLRRCWPQQLLILPDAVAAESFRALRVWLRWGLPKQIKSVEIDDDGE